MVAVLDKPLPVRDRQYGSAAVCAAAGIDKKTFNNWLSRQPPVIRLSDDERREAGIRQRFTFDLRRVVHIALTAHLVGLGLQPRHAMECADKFSDGGQSGGRSVPDRQLGELFKDGDTYLLIPPEPAAVRCVPMTPETTLDELLHPDYEPARSSLILVRVNDIVKHVTKTLADF